MKISGKTKLVTIFGDPLTYTLSPAFQNAGFAKLKLDWSYVALPGDAAALKKIWKGLIESPSFMGANVTIPHKLVAMGLADRLSPEAKAIGAVNTLYKKGKNWIGHNTDGDGFLNALNRAWGRSLKGKNLLLLGTGGSARAIAWAASKKGAAVLVAGRNKVRANALARGLKNVSAIPLDDKFLAALMDSSDVIVNTIPDASVGRRLGRLLPRVKKNSAVVFDITYKPALSPLMKAGKQKAWKVVNGLPMLLEQGILSFQCWTGRRAPRKEMQKALGRDFVS